MNWYTNLKIGNKLLLVALLALLGLGGLGSFFIVQMGQVYEKANYANINSLPSLGTLARARSGSKDYYIGTLRHIQNTDPARMNMIEGLIANARQATEKALDDYEKMLSDDTDRRMLSEDRSSFAG